MKIERGEVETGRGVWEQRSPENRRVVTALGALLSSIPLEELLKFLHRLHIRFSLVCHGKGYLMRIFQHETDADGTVRTILDYSASGDSPMAAIRNCMSEWLVLQDGDYHTFMQDKERVRLVRDGGE